MYLILNKRTDAMYRTIKIPEEKSGLSTHHKKTEYQGRKPHEHCTLLHRLVSFSCLMESKGDQNYHSSARKKLGQVKNTEFNLSFVERCGMSVCESRKDVLVLLFFKEVTEIKI